MSKHLHASAEPAPLGRRGEARRALLLQAALDLFSKQGFEGTTTREIAERSGVSEAVVFRYFVNKRDLFGRVIAELGPARFAALPEAADGGEIDAALRRLLIRFLDSGWENRATLRVMILEAWRDSSMAESLHAQFAEQRRALRALLEERSRAGELAPDAVERAADVIGAAASGFLQRSLRSEPDDWNSSRSGFVDSMVSVLLDGVRGRSVGFDARGDRAREGR